MDLKNHGSPDFTMLSVAMRELRTMQVPLAPKKATDARAESPSDAEPAALRKAYESESDPDLEETMRTVAEQLGYRWR